MKTRRPLPLIAIVLVFQVMGGVYLVADDTAESVTAWTRWKSIEAAIALRPLDGPDDIIEKAEIIEDRSDDLTRERARLEEEMIPVRRKLQAMRDQREVLRDLADIKIGGDTQTRERLQDLAERIRREESLSKMMKESMAELAGELERMRDLAAAYREKARLLRLEEGAGQ